MSRVPFSLGFSSMEPKRRALRPIASHARHGDARRLPVNPDENRIRRELVEFHSADNHTEKMKAVDLTHILESLPVTLGEQLTI
jgi:hypothetical protein